MNNYDFNQNKEVNIASLLNYDLSKFKVYKPTSLFPVEKEDIVKAFLTRTCPICGKRLYRDRNGKFWRCKSKVSNDKFFVRDEVISKFK